MINASEAGEVATAVPFTDNVHAIGTAPSGPATADSPVQLTPFVSLDQFCNSQTGTIPGNSPSSGIPPENPLTITRGSGLGSYAGAATPTVGCDPKQQIDAAVLGSYLYIWENQTGPVQANPDAAHVGLSPVQLGLDTSNVAVTGGNLPPCSPFALGATAGPQCTTPDPLAGQPVPVNNGQFDEALGQLNTVTVQDDRGTLTGWTVTGQLESNFNNQGFCGGTPVVCSGPHGPAVDNVIPADFLTWNPGVALSTPGTLPANNANTAGCPDQSSPPANWPYPPAYWPGCTGPSGTPQGTGTAPNPVNGTGVGTPGTTADSTPAEVFAGQSEPLNNLQGSADVLCATNLSLAGGAAGGGGSFDCSAGLQLAIPPYVASGDYRSVMDITILGF